MDRLKKILAISLPIMAGMMSQNVLNLVDIAMVGRLGPTHIAAVGLGGLCSFLMGAYVIGFAAAVQTMSARRLGEGRPETTAFPLNGGLMLAAAVGIPATIILIIITPRIYPFINHDAEVISLGIPYLKARLIATVAMGMNFSFSGFWNGTNRSHRYMSVLIATNVLNIFFNWVFIFGHLGALQEIMQRIRLEEFAGQRPKVIATGGFASLFDGTDIFDQVVPDLVLHGLLDALKLNVAEQAV